MTTPFEQPIGHTEKEGRPLTKSPLIPGEEYATGTPEKKNPLKESEEIARALGHNDPELTKKYLSHEDI